MKSLTVPQIALFVVALVTVRLLATAIEHDAWRSFTICFIHLVVVATATVLLLRDPTPK